jgi:hypothetical protein
MPSFTVNQPRALRANGPLFQLQIGVPRAVEDAMKAAGDPIPTPVTVQAMIDTGASLTIVRAGICAALGLHPVGVVNIGTASAASVPAEQFSVRLAFPNAVEGMGVVTEAPMPVPGCQALIGRDILSKAVFIYIGYADLFTLSF